MQEIEHLKADLHTIILQSNKNKVLKYWNDENSTDSKHLILWMKVISVLILNWFQPPQSPFSLQIHIIHMMVYDY